MKILIVDDNETRRNEIKDLLIQNIGLSENDIYLAENTQTAKSILRNICFDFLILDVVLPKRVESPRAQFGLNLLNEIKNRPTLKKPGKIVGITAHFDDIETFRRQFEQHCEVLIEASNRNTEWKGILLKAIEFESTRRVSNYTSENKILCITVHGIRTKGSWQERLKKIVESKVNTVEFHSYKYGYFTVISFFIPFLRKVKLKHFAKELISIRDRNNENKEMMFFCHSFGTYIVVKGINDYLLKKGEKINIKLIVLAGSVLPSNFDFQMILDKTNARVVNDCGSDDRILFLSEALVPNTGMAGRIGFYGLNNNRFVNRYYKGGHSHYFEQNDKFMERSWLPLIGNPESIDIIDNREDDSLLNVFFEKSISIFGKVKELVYLLVFVCFLYFVYKS
ncbi:response regulator [Hafnia sp. CBA7124]|uniref:response regulator n=1 Tax=Hafnia sp. CBA7124 TaxID=1848580 RepID=UPI000BBAEC42|nr:response regulator [Hafnia sp. CBA7124]